MPQPPQINVLIPLYKGRNTIRECLASLVRQQHVSLQILLLDNGCPENTGNLAETYLTQQGGLAKWRFLREPVNVGFAAGTNRLYSESSDPWVCFLNQDVTLEKDHLSNLVSALEGHPGWAGACGTLHRAVDESERPVIDTTGHVIFRDRIVRNRGAGREIEPGQDPYPEGAIFGISAACAMYRREALEAAGEEEGPFDPDFFAYFEDIDLDYRLHRAGWELGYTPKSVGRHELAGSGGRRELAVKLRAYGNRRRIMWKHESFGSLAPDLIPIVAQDLFAFLRAMISDPIPWLVGPWVFALSIPRILTRRRRLDQLFGTDRQWIRTWLRPEHERWTER